MTVDVGGTHLRVAVYPEGAIRPIAHQRAATQGEEPPEERLLALLARVWPRVGVVRGVGIAAPGPLDPARGVVLAAPNIPQWRDFPLADVVARRFDVPVWVDNDANLAALGEWRYGAAQGHRHVLYLTISTGIGGGVLIDGRLLHGARGLAGELGHVQVIPEGGPRCGCGRHGHLEAVASGPAIARAAEEALAQGRPSVLAEAPRPLTARQVAEAAQQGDPLAREVFARAARYLGQALAGYLHIFNPSVVVLGGGVVQAGEVLLRPLRQALEGAVMHPRYLADCALTTARLGDDAGLLGALALVRQHLHLEEAA